MNRRQWVQNSLLASSGVLVGGIPAAQSLGQFLGPDDPLLRLNWNENPYGPSDRALTAMTAALKDSNHYPDALIDELKQKIAAKTGVENSQVLLTAGSTEVLSLLGQHVGLMHGEILTPWPSFPTMMRFGERCGARIRKIPLDSNDRIDLQATLEAISGATSLVFICNPNNPTSTELDTAELKEFCRAVPASVLICVDEAYIEYSKHSIAGSIAGLVQSLPNLIICRTFSKAYGLAGLRIGYAISSKPNIDALRARHTGWEMSAGLAPLVAARAALDDHGFLDHCVRRNAEGRQIVYDAFKKWDVAHARSSTNFIYTRSAHFVPDVRDKLRDEHILITKWPEMHDHIRISIGKPEEMRRFVKVVEPFLV